MHLDLFYFILSFSALRSVYHLNTCIEKNIEIYDFFERKIFKQSSENIMKIKNICFQKNKN